MADLQGLFNLFEQHANPDLAYKMAKYMGFNFEFFGIQKPLRQKLQKQFWQNHGYPQINELNDTILELWNHPKREPQYTALDLLDKFKTKLPQDFITTVEKLITTKPWWDTVDLLAAKIVFNLFEKYPELEQKYFDKWLNSNNLWLQRTTLIYQLKRKDSVNYKNLEKAIEQLKNSQEFFIQKAIGWALREISKFNPQYVTNYVENHDLPALSRREALRYLNRKKN